MQLVPQGAIPRATRLDVRLTPLGVAPKEDVAEAPAPEPPECVVECSGLFLHGWTSSGGIASSVSGSAGATGSDTTGLVFMEGGPWTVRIDLLATTCGNPINWTFSGDLVEGTDFVTDGSSSTSTWLFGAAGCDPPYAGYLVVQAQVWNPDTEEYEDFCEELTLSFSGAGGGCGEGPTGCCFEEVSFGGDVCSGSIPLPNGPFDTWTIRDVGPNAGNGGLSWSITNIGDGSITVIPDITDLGGGDYLISYDGSYTFGALWMCQPYLGGEPYCPDYPVLVFGNDNS